MKCSKFIPILLIIPFFISCKKKDTPMSNPGTGTGTSQIKTYNINSDGATINDSATGVTIEIPKNATTSEFDISINKLGTGNALLNLISGNSYPQASDIYLIENNLMGYLDSCAIITIPYYPNKVPDPTSLEIVYYSDISGSWLPGYISSIDTTNHTVSFFTLHFSKWALCVIPHTVGNVSEFVPLVETGFTPELDGFPIINNFPPPYDDPTNTKNVKGNCAGFSIFAIWYYTSLRNLTGRRLYEYAYRGPDPNLQGPNPNETYYNSIYKGIYTVSKKSVASFFSPIFWKNFLADIPQNLLHPDGFIPISEKGLAVKIYNDLVSANSPIFLGIKDASGTLGHAVVVYKFKKELDGSGAFYYYDPNLPGEEKSFKYNSDGTIIPFQYGGIQGLYASELKMVPVSGLISLKNIKKIFDTYFESPLNSTPSVSTSIVSNITGNSAISGGDISKEGDANITSRGVCWSTIENPTIADNKTYDGTEPGVFQSKIVNLQPNTTYYVRAYATNEYGVSYGNEETFTTSKDNTYGLVFSDDFNNPAVTEDKFTFTNPNWGSGGNHTVAHSVKDGYLELRMDQTDANSNAIVNYDFSSFNKIKIVCDLYYQEGPRYYSYQGNQDFYFPQISLCQYSTKSETITGGNFQILMQTDYYQPDNPCGSAIYPSMRYWTSSSSNASCPQQFKRMNSFATATSKSFYGRWLNNATIIFDKSSGYVSVDIDGDGLIDMEGYMPNSFTGQLNTIMFSPYGWWTGHLMRIRNLKIYAK